MFYYNRIKFINAVFFTLYFVLNIFCSVDADPLSKKDLKAVKSGDKSIVMLHMTGT